MMDARRLNTLNRPFFQAELLEFHQSLVFITYLFLLQYEGDKCKKEFTDVKNMMQTYETIFGNQLYQAKHQMASVFSNAQVS